MLPPFSRYGLRITARKFSNLTSSSARLHYISIVMAKRKRSTATAVTADASAIPPPLSIVSEPPKPVVPQRRRSARAVKISTNPDANGDILDAPNALRASPDSDVDPKTTPGNVKGDGDSDSPLSDVPLPEVEPPKKKRVTSGKKAPQAPKSNVNGSAAPSVPAKKVKKADEEDVVVDPEAENAEDADEEEVKEALSRPPPVNSDYLPLPWKGRLGYACLNTYLRFSNPPVFSSRTCRIASILEHRHPLADPSQAEHATKNRPDKDQPADIKRGQKYVESIGLANARDIIKMVRWNDKYGIKFMRLSSEMFPFASHEEYGYKLAPFAAETLAEAGKVIAELGHRVTTHPGQFTQLGSPRKVVVDNAIRDLTYHDEMLSLLKLPPQENRDAVMILHMGGTFGDKAATLDRFRENYAKLPQSIKNRLVLENDDVCYSVHDLLPICQELNIPFVLDFHHHNIVFDADKIREGTKDIMSLFPQILETWNRKRITPKMHYSEPTPAAITGMQRRKHSPRVATLPPCPSDMDLMIEAKDKEQAVFELMRTFKLPGWDLFSDVVPHVRKDDNKLVGRPKKKATPKKKKGKKVNVDDEDIEELEAAAETLEEEGPAVVPDEEVGMGGPDRRVYWPPGMEEWLRPKKREVKKKDKGKENGTPAKTKKRAAAKPTPNDAEVNGNETIDEPDTKKHKTTVKPKAGKKVKSVPTPSTSDTEDIGTPSLPEEEEEADIPVPTPKTTKPPPSRKGARTSKRATRVSYAETDEHEDGA